MAYKGVRRKNAGRSITYKGTRVEGKGGRHAPKKGDGVLMKIIKVLSSSKRA